MQHQQHQWPAGGPLDPSHAGRTGLALTAKHFPLAWIFALLKPNVIINGQAVPAAWGRNVIDLAPGRYHLHVHVPYFMPRQLGAADLEILVNPAQVVELEYRAPVVAFVRGSLGGPPQKYRGLGILIAATVLLLVCAGMNVLLLLFGADAAGRDRAGSSPAAEQWTSAPHSGPVLMLPRGTLGT